jgi:hypothetical protein
MSRTIRIIRPRNSASSNVAMESCNLAGAVHFSSASVNVAVCTDAPSTLRNIGRDDSPGRCLAGGARRQGDCQGNSAMWLLPATAHWSRLTSN